MGGEPLCIIWYSCEKGIIFWCNRVTVRCLYRHLVVYRLQLVNCLSVGEPISGPLLALYFLMTIQLLYLGLRMETLEFGPSTSMEFYSFLVSPRNYFALLFGEICPAFFPAYLKML